MKIVEIMQRGRELLSPRDQAALESEILLAYVLGESKEFLVTNSYTEMPPELEGLYLNYIDRLRAGEPIAYIIGNKEFYGLNFFVDSRVLVPRPETEGLVDRVFDFLKPNMGNGNRFRIIDVGTGSGNIAISIASGLENEDIDTIEAIDVSEEALEVARINAAQHGVEDRMQIYQADLLEGVEEGSGFDVIVANLPYIGEVKHRYVSSDAEKFEPSVALFGGENGLTLYEKLFKQTSDKKVNFGLMLGEFGFAQGEDMVQLLDNYFENRWKIHEDLAGIERIFAIIN